MNLKGLDAAVLSAVPIVGDDGVGLAVDVLLLCSIICLAIFELLLPLMENSQTEMSEYLV